ncbi:MAG: hypothetical protein AAGF02_03510 [Actinomycetota bacterium]
MLVVGVFVGSDRIGRFGSDDSVGAPVVERGRLLYAVRYDDPFRYGDDVARDLLVADGWEVTIRIVDSSGDIGLDEAATFDALVVSASVHSSHLTDTGRAVVPIVTWERAAYDEMGLFSVSGSLPDDRSFAVDDAHPLVEDLGLSGSVTFSTVGRASAGGGTPIDGLVPLGTFADDRIGWFEVGRGETLTDGSAAPACRVGLPFNDKSETLTGLTDEGRALLVHSVRYAAADCAVVADPVVTTTVPTTTTVPPSTSTPSAVPSATTTVPPTPRSGYVVGDDGRATALVPGSGSAQLDADTELAGPIVAAMSSGSGWWTVDAAGVVEANDGAPELGDLGDLALNEPIVAAAATPTGDGFLLIASDGGVFAFGDARYAGSLGSVRLNEPIVAGAATPTGDGYWLFAADGGVFAFGDAAFYGSLGGLTLNSPISTAAATPSGAGYWMVAADGGVFAFGDAVFHGSEADSGERWVLAAPHLDGDGYTMVAVDGSTAVHGAPLPAASDVTADGVRPVAFIVLAD